MNLKRLYDDYIKILLNTIYEIYHTMFQILLLLERKVDSNMKNFKSQLDLEILSSPDQRRDLIQIANSPNAAD